MCGSEAHRSLALMLGSSSGISPGLEPSTPFSSTSSAGSADDSWPKLARWLRVSVAHQTPPSSGAGRASAAALIQLILG